jgi:alpha-amylase
VNNESEVLTSKGESSGYTVAVKGTKGNMLLQLGNTTTNTEGYQLAVSGENYKLYVSNDLDISEIKNVVDETNTTKLPDFVTVQEGTYAYFEKPQNWGSTIHVWAWNSKNNNENVYSGALWPGTISDKDITKVGTNNGCDVFLWKYSGTKTPDMIIFNDGTNQTSNLKFTNGGYYNYAQGLVATGINDVKVPTLQAFDINAPKYNIAGQRVSKTYKGIYIQNGKKYITR